nr:hypothetical protein [Tanacetum cinerariifolium]
MIVELDRDKGVELIGILVEEPKPMKKKQQIEMDEAHAKKLHEELNQDIDWDVAIEHQIEEEESSALESINETPAQKAAKRRRLNQEDKDVEEIKQHLEIVPNEDNGVYTEATLLARKCYKDAAKLKLKMLMINTAAAASSEEITKRLKKVKTSQRVETSDDTIMEDVSNQGRMIVELDRDKGVELIGEKEKTKEDDLEVQEAVEVVTTAKLITKVVNAASTPVSAASTIIPTTKKIIPAVELNIPAVTITAAPVKVAVASTRRRRRVVIRDPEEESSTKTSDETMSKDKGKGKSYDDIRPIFKAKFNTNMEFILKSKEQIEEEESSALESINETPSQKAAKRRRLNQEDKDVEEIKQHLEIVPNEDNGVYTEATPLARKVPVVDYHIILLNSKP